MGVLVAGGLTGLLNQSSAQIIDGSLKFDSGSQTTLTRTNSSSGNRKTWTLSFWTKRLFDSGNYQSYLMGKTDVTEGFNLRINDPTDQKFYLATVSGSGLTSDAVFRDFSAWMHVVIVYNSTDSTSTDRVRLYVNGERQTFGSGSYPSLNLDGEFNNSGDFGIGYHNGNTALDAYLSEYHFIDGQALDSSYFGYTDPLTNTWRPKKYTGTFTGTNTFYLPMDGNSPIGQDKSGNGNNWTAVNFSGTSIDPDVLKDSPSGAVSGGRAQTGITTTSSAPANYCTLNPIDAFVSTKDGNLETATSSGWQSIRATLGMKSGKFYWETQNNQDAAAILGIADTQATGFVDGAIFGSTGHGGGDANPAWTWAGANYYFNATTAGTGLSNHVSSDVVQYAFDADSGNLWFGRNGTWYNSSWATTGDPANGVNPTVSGIDTTKTYVACGSFYNGSAKFNFGQKPFKYAPPQGYLPLNSASGTPETVVPRPNQYMNTVTYTGTGSDLTLDVGFKPDLSYFSTRSATGYIKYIFDSVRGATKYLATSHTQGDDAEGTSSSTLKSFNANGVTIGNNAQMNENSSNTWVSWHWKAGGNKNTFNVDDVGYASAAAAGLDGGNKTPTGASVGTKQGFSIVKFTNDTTSPITLSHGLTQAPTFVILKALTGSVGWTVGHTSIGFTKRLKLNGTDAESASANFFNDTAPTSSLITLGANNVSNDFIMYSWHDVPGLQKFGSYSSNNSTDGPFIELGFRPALILIKESGASGQSWNICDTSRNSSNPANKVIALNSNAAEYSYTTFDILSNGFKIRTNDNGWNGSSSTFIYAAWAEAPVSNLYGGQSNAR